MPVGVVSFSGKRSEFHEWLNCMNFYYGKGTVFQNERISTIAKLESWAEKWGGVQVIKEKLMSR